MECVRCAWLGVGGEGCEWMRGLGLGFTNPVGTWGVRRVSVLRWRRWEWVGCLDQGLQGWCYVCVSPDSLCRWQVQVSVYCVRRIKIINRKWGRRAINHE